MIILSTAMFACKAVQLLCEPAGGGSGARASSSSMEVPRSPPHAIACYHQEPTLTLQQLRKASGRGLTDAPKAARGRRLG